VRPKRLRRSWLRPTGVRGGWNRPIRLPQRSCCGASILIDAWSEEIPRLPRRRPLSSRAASARAATSSPDANLAARAVPLPKPGTLFRMKTGVVYAVVALLGPIVMSCADQTAAKGYNVSARPKACTLNYLPVCAKRHGVVRTYSNACGATADRAKIVADGPCPITRPQ
jgi:hypothetical protein